MSGDAEHQQVCVQLMDTDATSTPNRSCIKRMWNNDVIKIGVSMAIFILFLLGGWGLYSYLSGAYKRMCDKPGFCR